MVFGIDYGSHLAKVAVFDRAMARPKILLNSEDRNAPYWHTAVAYDKKQSKLVSGSAAKAIVRLFSVWLFSIRFRALQGPLYTQFPLLTPTNAC